MEAVLGNSKDYTLKQYLLFVDKLQTKSKVSFIFLLSVRLKSGVLFTSHCLDFGYFNCISVTASCHLYGWKFQSDSGVRTLTFVSCFGLVIALHSIVTDCTGL
jgi:hypothetical protein